MESDLPALPIDLGLPPHIDLVRGGAAPDTRPAPQLGRTVFRHASVAARGALGRRWANKLQRTRELAHGAQEAVFEESQDE
jgi:hypothetical protein